MSLQPVEQGHQQFGPLCYTRGYVWLVYVVNAALVLIAITLSRPAAAETIKILAFGDSLTAGYNLSQDQSYPAQLEGRLRQQGIDVRVINAGVSGDTTAGGRARLSWSLNEKPDAAILELGANDGLRGLDPAQTYENLDAMMKMFGDLDIPVLLAGMLAPPNLGRDYGQEFETVFSRLNNKYDVVYYPFFLEGVAAIPDLNLEDGIHPTGEGYKRIVDNLLPSVMELIERAKQKRS